MNAKCAVLVVLYGKEISGSKTLNSILNYKKRFENTLLVIVNNGPDYLYNVDVSNFECIGLNVKLVQTIENQPLSSVYNKFISDNESERYIILDDDSVLTGSYIESFINDSFSIGVPKATVRGKVISPRINANKFVAIGSGIVINKKILDIIHEVYGDYFDERFKFYGVDTTFFYRLKALQKIQDIKLLPEIQHSHSSYEKESDEKKAFRVDELSYAKGLEYRYYLTEAGGGFSLLSLLLSTFLKVVFQKKRYISFFKMSYTFLLGKKYI